MTETHSVLWELGSPERSDIFDSFDCSRTKVCRKQLIPIHGQAFFERELEPITARDSLSQNSLWCCPTSAHAQPS